MLLGLTIVRGVFRTQSNIYDEAYLRKELRVESCSLFSEKITSEMFGQILNIPLIFTLLGGKLSRSFFHVKINSQLTHSSKGGCSLCNIYESYEFAKTQFFYPFLFYQISELTCAISVQCHLHCNVKLFLCSCISIKMKPAP